MLLCCRKCTVNMPFTSCACSRICGGFVAAHMLGDPCNRRCVLRFDGACKGSPRMSNQRVEISPVMLCASRLSAWTRICSASTHIVREHICGEAPSPGGAPMRLLDKESLPPPASSRSRPNAPSPPTTPLRVFGYRPAAVPGGTFPLRVPAVCDPREELTYRSAQHEAGARIPPVLWQTGRGSSIEAHNGPRAARTLRELHASVCSRRTACDWSTTTTAARARSSGDTARMHLRRTTACAHPRTRQTCGATALSSPLAAGSSMLRMFHCFGCRRCIGHVIGWCSCATSAPSGTTRRRRALAGSQLSRSRSSAPRRAIPFSAAALPWRYVCDARACTFIGLTYLDLS